MNGILNVDKPPGVTSHDVVGQVRRLLRQKRVGHAGTLDPDATGVLLICLGQATRLAEYLADAGKAYRAVLVLGQTTTTEDAGGVVLTETDASAVTEDALRSVLPRFVGDILQVPPMVSAVHHEGKRLYELARQGVVVERAARPVHVESIALTDFTAGARATAMLDIDCGKGTYIRTLCADIGDALGVGGHMASLRRTQVGAFSVNEAIPLDALTAENVAAHLHSPADALAHWPTQTASPTEMDDIAHGRALPTTLAEGTEARLLSSAGELLALGRVSGGTVRPFKVFAA